MFVNSVISLKVGGLESFQCLRIVNLVLSNICRIIVLVAASMFSMPNERTAKSAFGITVSPAIVDISLNTFCHSLCKLGHSQIIWCSVPTRPQFIQHRGEVCRANLEIRYGVK